MFASFNARAVGLALPAVHTVELAARHGFGGVDLLVRDLIDAGEDPARIRGRMDTLGLRGGAWPLPVHWRGDEASYRADLARLPELAQAASILGLQRTGTWVLPETPGPPDDDVEQAFEFHARRLGPVARILADHDVAIGLEVIGVESFRTGQGRPMFVRFGGELVGRLLDGLREETPGVGLVADAFHLHAAGEPIETTWRRGAASIIWAHVADLPAGADCDRRAIHDADRGLPGENGAVDCGGFLRGLAEAGYVGPVTVEPLAGCRSLTGLSVEATVRKVAAAISATWPLPGG